MRVADSGNLIYSKRSRQVESAQEKIRLVEELLFTVPTAGTGVNSWLPKAAYRLHRSPFLLDDEAIAFCLKEAIVSAGRKPKGDEVERAIWFTHPYNPNNIRRKSKAPSAHLTGDGQQKAVSEPKLDLVRNTKLE